MNAADYAANWGDTFPEWPKLTLCSHPHCRTTLTEDTLTYCPHERPTCEDCSWEDSCAECSELAGGVA